MDTEMDDVGRGSEPVGKMLAGAQRLKIVHVLLTTAHGNLCYMDLRAGMRGVTGSEQAMLYLAKEQVKQGHDVTIYLPTANPGMDEGVRLLDVNRTWPRFAESDNADVMISWLSADPLRNAPHAALRICNIQINDWLPTVEGCEQFTDLFVAASDAHWQMLVKKEHHPAHEVPHAVMPNGTIMGHLPDTPRVPRRFVYLSSPDRGLHWALYIWPELRNLFPDAELHIFYEVRKWLEAVPHLGNEIGNRARYVGEKYNALWPHGVILHGAVAPTELEQRLMQCDVMLYPCDPVIFTEGFGVAVLDAAACGVVPVITDADALGEVYSESGAVIVPRKEGTRWVEEYLETVIQLVNNPAEILERRAQLKKFVQQYQWNNLGQRWETLIAQHPKIGKS